MEFLSGFWSGTESDFIFYHPSWTGFTTDRHTATKWSGVTDFGRNWKAKTQTEPDHVFMIYQKCQHSFS